MSRVIKRATVVLICIVALVLLWLQHARLREMRLENDGLRRQWEQAKGSPPASSVRPTRAPWLDAELFHLRGEIARLRVEQGALNSKSNTTGKAFTTDDDGELPFEMRRQNNTRVLMRAVLAMLSLADDRRRRATQGKLEFIDAEGKPTTTFRNEIEKLLSRDPSTRDTDLEAAWRDLEFLVTGGDEILKLDPNTIIARTIPLKTPDGKWMRVYAIADGSAHARSHNTPDEVWDSRQP
jgi:hypothetical protein